MAVATSNLSRNRINVLNTFDNKEKATLRSVSDSGVGVIAVCTEQENGSNSTTPANTNLRFNGAKAGRRYKVNAVVRMSNATGGNGGRCELNLTGTQTTAVFVGSAFVATQLTTPTLIPAAASGGILGNGTDYGANGTAAGSNFVDVVIDGIVIPQNDGDLVIGVGSGTGSTQSRLEPGSYLQVREITF